MGYTPQQIGWSVEAKLLQEVIKKLDQINRTLSSTVTTTTTTTTP
jgi:hypothetical protein